MKWNQDIGCALMILAIGIAVALVVWASRS
jgi:hypothetical protein